MADGPPLPPKPEGVTFWATFDGDRPTGFYPDDVWPADKRPPEAVEITWEQYQELLNTPQPIDTSQEPAP